MRILELVYINLPVTGDISIIDNVANTRSIFYSYVFCLCATGLHFETISKCICINSVWQNIWAYLRSCSHTSISVHYIAIEICFKQYRSTKTFATHTFFYHHLNVLPETLPDTVSKFDSPAVSSLRPSGAYMAHQISLSLVCASIGFNAGLL